MAAVAASASSPYDEMVVPALRKRLEAESHMLTKRLSGHSTFDDLPPTTPSQQQQQPSSSKLRQRVASPELYSKPSSIPRPSLQMSNSYANSSREALGLATPASVSRGTKSDRLLATSVMKTTSSARQQQQDAVGPPTQTPRRARTRTQSTPYAYDELTAPPIPDVPSALPTPASSRSTSPLAASTSALPLRPSGIPVPRSVSNTRSGAPKTPRSRSRTGSTSAGTADDRRPRGAEDDFLSPMRYPPSPEPSPELAYAAINGEPISLRMIQPPFPLTGSVTGGGASDSETGGRSSSERNRGPAKEYEFWYRGDKARNGGRGEVHRVGTAEMLEIAAFGHRLREERKGMETKGSSARQREAEGRGGGAGKRSVPLPGATRQASEWGDEPAYVGEGGELEEDSVMRERPLSWVIDAEGSVTDLVLESLGREQYRNSAMLLQQQRQQREEEEYYEEPVELEPMRYESAAPPLANRELSKSAPAGSRPAAMSKSTTTGRLNGTGNRNARTTRIPASTAPRQRKHGLPTTNGSQQPKPTSTPATRSVSQPAHMNRDSVVSMSLVDAIPDVPSRRAEKTKNWDEVVLPTVARRLGLDEQEEEAQEGVGEFGEREGERVPPAPGTFGYDMSKYRSPSDYPPSTALPPSGPLASSTPDFPPPRPGSPAPFASYTPVPPRPASPLTPTSPPPPIRPEPVLLKSATAVEREKQHKGKRPPKIVVSGPAGLEEEDESHGSGCKCVIM